MIERKNIEWKRSWQDEYLKWICGFANAQGVSIFIGGDDAIVHGTEPAGKIYIPTRSMCARNSVN